MLDFKKIYRIDFRIFPLILTLMLISLLVISSTTQDRLIDNVDESWITPTVKSQMQWFLIGWVVFFLFAAFDYNKLREWTWILYAFMLASLVGLFFAGSIVGVNRWYRLPIVNINVQPSEYAKLIVVITLSWFLERNKQQAGRLRVAILASIIVGIPFLLILKQPDLGTALVLMPITLVMFYFGDVNRKVVKIMTWTGGALLLLIALIFLGILPHESLRPMAIKVMKEYQFDRLDPNTHHQKAAATAIAIGGFTGEGWQKGEYTARGWLPASYTDSVFPSFGEEFGFLGLLLLLLLFYALIYFSFQVAAVAKDHFGRLLSAGIAVYLAMHILTNIGMMLGFLPITGVPLILVTYGGSSIISTMGALGLLQSIYSRRFMF